MMEHIYKVIRPLNFQGWADTARQYHQDNMAVQNIRGLYEDSTKKKPNSPKTGFTAQQLAQILGVKMPAPGPNQMDTRADRTRSNWRNKGTQGRATTVDPEEQRKQGRCFQCNKQGHIARNCPDKPKEKKALPPVTRGRKVEIEDASDDESDTSSVHGAKAVAWDKDEFLRLARAAPLEEKINMVREAGTEEGF